MEEASTTDTAGVTGDGGTRSNDSTPPLGPAGRRRHGAGREYDRRRRQRASGPDRQRRSPPAPPPGHRRTAGRGRLRRAALPPPRGVVPRWFPRGGRVLRHLRLSHHQSDHGRSRADRSHQSGSLLAAAGPTTSPRPVLHAGHHRGRLQHLRPRRPVAAGLRSPGRARVLHQLVAHLPPRELLPVGRASTPRPAPVVVGRGRAVLSAVAAHHPPRGRSPAADEAHRMGRPGRERSPPAP